MQNQSAITPPEYYIEKAEQAQKDLVKGLHSLNVTGAYRFISDALAHAMTHSDYDDREARVELCSNYYGLAYILEKCLELEEAQAFADHAEKTLAREKQQIA